MIAGPMVIHLSTCSRCITCSTPMVTNPFCPIDPSSVITITSSETSASCSRKIIKSAVRAAKTVMTLFPACLRACAIGNIGAAPTPPQAQTTVPKCLIVVALPKGPTKLAILSPGSNAKSLVLLIPIRCTTKVMVPFIVSASAIVSGMRSLCASTRTITKCPARRLRAIKGASITNSATFSEKKRFDTIFAISTASHL